MTSTLAPHQLLRIGQPVHVNHHASWLPATVTCLTPREVGVSYQAGYPIGGPAPLADTVLPWAVRPAEGALLRPARLVTAGDEDQARADDANRTSYRESPHVGATPRRTSPRLQPPWLRP